MESYGWIKEDFILIIFKWYRKVIVNEEFEAYPDFSIDKSKSEIKFRISSDEFYAIELKKKVKLLVIFI